MTYQLTTSVRSLPGIGSTAAKDLKSQGITDIHDLLWYVPFRYDDFSVVKKISELQHDDR